MSYSGYRHGPQSIYPGPCTGCMPIHQLSIEHKCRTCHRLFFRTLLLVALTGTVWWTLPTARWRVSWLSQLHVFIVVILLRLSYCPIARWLAEWRSGRTSVSGQRTFPVLRTTCTAEPLHGVINIVFVSTWWNISQMLMFSCAVLILAESGAGSLMMTSRSMDLSTLNTSHSSPSRQPTRHKYVLCSNISPSVLSWDLF